MNCRTTHPCFTYQNTCLALLHLADGSENIQELYLVSELFKCNFCPESGIQWTAKLDWNPPCLKYVPWAFNCAHTHTQTHTVFHSAHSRGGISPWLSGEEKHVLVLNSALPTGLKEPFLNCTAFLSFHLNTSDRPSLSKTTVCCVCVCVWGGGAHTHTHKHHMLTHSNSQLTLSSMSCQLNPPPPPTHTHTHTSTETCIWL